MKVTYCGCKSVMKTQKTAFPRGKSIEVTEAIGNEVMKIDGFYLTMDAVAKKELKSNVDREKLEVKKLEEGVKIVEVEVEVDNSELETHLQEAIDEIAELQNTVETLQKELLIEQAKSVTAKVK